MSENKGEKESEKDEQVSISKERRVDCCITNESFIEQPSIAPILQGLDVIYSDGFYQI